MLFKIKVIKQISYFFLVKLCKKYLSLCFIVSQPFLCHQHLCCVAYRDCFVIQFCGVIVVVCWRRRQQRRLWSSHFVFWTVSQKWHFRFNSNLACGCKCLSGCAVKFGDLKLPQDTYIEFKFFSFPDNISKMA